MLFFSENLLEFNKAFSYIFGLGVEEDGEEREEHEDEDDDTRIERNSTEPNKSYGIMCLMKEYYDFTGVIFPDIWSINIIEFFQTIAFIKEYKKREEEKMKEYMKKFKRN